ncbi:MAG: GNAT family N-acetyltransferase [Actinomycetota bacterium]
MTFPGPYRARPARGDDLDALVVFFEACDRVDVGFIDPSRDEILADWATVRFEFDRDTVIAEAPDGTIAAYGLVLALDATVQIFAMGRVHPDHTGSGLGSALLRETERRAALRLPAGVSAPLRTGMASTDDAALGLFLERGYRHVRSFWHMQRGLPADDAPADVPGGITVRLGGPGNDEVIAYRVLDEAFEQHFGYEPMDQEEWLQEFRGMPGYDPSLIVLAFEGDQPVGVSVNMAADDSVGWVGDLGVREPWRRRGVGRALLIRSFAELAARGHHEVRLGVDTENATGATHLYEGVGMSVRRRYDLYEKTVTGA